MIRTTSGEMSNKVEINKNGPLVNWHGQSWIYYKGMIRLAFKVNQVLEYATGDTNLAQTLS